MQIACDNLPPAIRRSAQEDLECVRRLAPGKGASLPQCRLFLVALDAGDVPDRLPAHAVSVPDREVPATFARCSPAGTGILGAEYPS